MEAFPNGEALVYCQGAFRTTDGKTAHGLVRFTRRYKVKAVIDSELAGRDAGEYLDGKSNGIPIVASLEEGEALLKGKPRYFVVGLAVVGGRLAGRHRTVVGEALRRGFHVDCGLHDYLGDDPEFAALAAAQQVAIRDVRKSPPPSKLHAFEGKIAEVTSFKIASLGTDSAVGKRTTAWKIVQGYEASGLRAEFVGTGQTAWMQGARYSVCFDSLVNDFVGGELEHAVWSAWHEQKPDVIVIEGQSSLLNPAYPGGFEILAATRPNVIVLQHAPARSHYEDFPEFPMHPLAKQIQALELVGDRPVVAVTLNHTGLEPQRVAEVCRLIERETGRPCMDVLIEGPARLIETLEQYRRGSRKQAP